MEPESTCVCSDWGKDKRAECAVHWYGIVHTVYNVHTVYYKVYYRKDKRAECTVQWYGTVYYSILIWYSIYDMIWYRVYYTKDKCAECAVPCKKQTISTVHGNTMPWYVTPRAPIVMWYQIKWTKVPTTKQPGYNLLTFQDKQSEVYNYTIQLYNYTTRQLYNFTTIQTGGTYNLLTFQDKQSKVGKLQLHRSSISFFLLLSGQMVNPGRQMGWPAPLAGAHQFSTIEIPPVHTTRNLCNWN